MPAKTNDAARSNRVVSRPAVAVNTRNLFVLELIFMDAISCCYCPERWQELQENLKRRQVTIEANVHKLREVDANVNFE
jgi:hypothetical protein